MTIKRWTIFLVLCFASVAATAQDDAAAIRSEHWNFGVLASGGSGLFDRDDVQFARAGVRVGRVMTGELGSGIIRGTFELDSEIIPVEVIHWSDYKDVYSVSVNPLVMKWNFTRARNRKLIPYFLAQGGVTWSAHDVPPGDTSRFNFTSGAGVGFNYFLKPCHSVNFDLRATHFSNASLGDHNPGVNSSLQVSIGYNWWKQKH